MAILVKKSEVFPRERVRLRMVALLKSVKKRREWTHSAHKVVLTNMMTVSADLWLLGSRSLDPSSLGSKHLASLIQMWKEGAVDLQGHQLRRPISRKAASQLWTAVGHWTSAVGKANIRIPFRSAWPDEAAQAVLPTGARRSKRLLLTQIDEATYQTLLGTWRDEPGRRLNYWLARAVRELELSVVEALRFAPRSAMQAGGKSIVVTKWVATSQRRIELDTADKLAVIQGLVDYLKQTQQVRLCWPKGGTDGVESLEVAEVKFREAVRYQVHRIERARVKAEAELESESHEVQQ